MAAKKRKRDIINGILNWAAECKLEMIFDVMCNARSAGSDLPDLFVAIPMSGSAGLWLRIGNEQKHDDGLRGMGFAVVVCKNEIEAKRVISNYLGEPWEMIDEE